jgi:hypothetical protein
MMVYVTGVGEQFDTVEWEDFQLSVHHAPEGAERWLREHWPIPDDAVFELAQNTVRHRLWVYNAPGGHPDIFIYQEHEVQE